MGENHFEALPTAIYGVVLMMTGGAYLILQQCIIAKGGDDSELARAIGKDFKGKISLVGYVLGILLAFVNPWFSDALYALVAMLWLIPDRRIEKVVSE
jgi:uncharacterized membrane protein